MEEYSSHVIFLSCQIWEISCGCFEKSCKISPGMHFVEKLRERNKKKAYRNGGSGLICDVIKIFYVKFR